MGYSYLILPFRLGPKSLFTRGIDLFEATSSKENFGEHISYLRNIRDIDISLCNIRGSVFPIHEFHNLSRLSTLKMNKNYDLNSSIPLQLANLTSLSILDLSSCGLQGSIPYLPQLKELDASGNYYLDPILTRMSENSWPRLQKLDISRTATVSIPSSTSNLSHLVSLSAANCRIQGSLPSSLYNLSRLQHLDLYSNFDITSSIHSSISNLKDLKFLDLSRCNIQGSIPNSICNISALQHLDLRYNYITGSLPSCITNLRNLSVLDVSYNSITGNVSLISLINQLDLTDLSMSYNKLTLVMDQHQYPSKFKLEYLDLESCSLRGFIPTYICNMTDLRFLLVTDNSLTGAIPSCISNLKNIDHLDLSKNRLCGPLPHLSPSVTYIALNDNELSGIIPSSIGNCSSLEYLNLGHNNLTGNIPDVLEQAEGLRYLLLNDNNFDSTFPMFIQKLLSLVCLNLQNNNFGGPIPSGIGSLKDLGMLSFRSNRFNGSIPEEIIHLQRLQILDLSLNNFSGPIPTKLGNISWLTSRISATDGSHLVQYELANKGTMAHFEQILVFGSVIDLSCNILTGRIPEEIGLLQGLGMLNLSHNQFSSSIPESIGNMSSLESLDLSSNRLYGHIPQSLTSIDPLQILSLSKNNLSGRIPRGNHFDTLSLDGSAFAGNELLCGFPLKKDCDDDHNTGDDDHNEDDQEDGKEKFLLYAIVAMGFAVGFWGLFFVLLVKKQKWWFPYWRTVDSVAVNIVEGCTTHRN